MTNLAGVSWTDRLTFGEVDGSPPELQRRRRPARYWCAATDRGAFPGPDATLTAWTMKRCGAAPT